MGLGTAFWSAENGVEPSAWEAYQDDLRNPELWLAREEERIGFESRHILRKGEKYAFNRFPELTHKLWSQVSG
jgi:hypothetical protein